MDACVSHEMITSTTGKADVLEVEDVVKTWVFDFYFVSLCRVFKDRSAEQFANTLKIIEAVDKQQSAEEWTDPSERTVCCFLARVMDGENLDLQYDHRSQISPLMSALLVWEVMEDVVSDPGLHAKIRTQLIVQCVAVCLRNGNSNMAKETLQWIENKIEIPEKLRGKLATLIGKKDAYDRLLMRFTYSQLLENIDTFLDTFLQKHSSDFLHEAASKVVQARHERSETASSEQDSVKRMQHSTDSKENEEQEGQQLVNLRKKKQLFQKQIHEPWIPECSKAKQSVFRRATIGRVTRSNCAPAELESNIIARSRTKRKWTGEEDLMLKAGVKKYGEGKWSMILNKFDFENRTGVMLKDRWRTLKNQGLVI